MVCLGLRANRWVAPWWLDAISAGASASVGGRLLRVIGSISTKGEEYEKLQGGAEGRKE